MDDSRKGLGNDLLQAFSRFRKKYPNIGIAFLQFSVFLQIQKDLIIESTIADISPLDSPGYLYLVFGRNRLVYTRSYCERCYDRAFSPFSRPGRTA